MIDYDRLYRKGDILIQLYWWTVWSLSLGESYKMDTKRPPWLNLNSFFQYSCPDGPQPAEEQAGYSGGERARDVSRDRVTPLSLDRRSYPTSTDVRRTCLRRGLPLSSLFYLFSHPPIRSYHCRIWMIRALGLRFPVSKIVL